VKPLPLRVGYL
jgi:hypothetical protein